jgi:polar amino acid transport system substrate-binding protein
MRLLISATAMLLAATLQASAQGAVPPDALKDLAPTGKLRAAINFGNGVLAQKGKDGEPLGITPDLANALGKRLGVPVELVRFEAAGKVAEALATSAVDVGFIAIEPVRADKIDFSPPYVVIEGTYMVAKDSAMKNVADVDKPGVRIAVGLNSAYDLYLTRTLKSATLVRAKIGGGGAGIDLFINDKLDAAAGVRQPLEDYAKSHPEMRVMADAFQEIRQAMGTPKGRSAAAAYLRGFIEDVKQSGFVADSLKRSNQPDAQVAPAEK